MSCSSCGRDKVHAKGLCGSCYSRWLKSGDPTKTKVKKEAECAYCGEFGWIKGHGFCPACFGRYIKNGSPERIKIKKRQPCGFCGIEKEIHAHGLCSSCYDRRRSNGTPEYQRVRHICTVDGCDDFVKSNGLCPKHYIRWKRHGHTESTRPPGWGDTGDHPLKNVYDHSVRRNNRYEVCQEWKDDFWKFIEEVGDRPSNRHRIKRIRNDLPLSGINFKWEEPLIANPNSDDIKKYRREYMVEYNKKSSRNIKNLYLLRDYGITIDEFEIKLEQQDFKCAICGENEKMVNATTKKINRLSIDHCHKTGDIRGLLCSNCNRGIGFFKDSQELLLKAIEYLKKHEK